MERRLKERLTGAVVLLLLAIIFVPMILDNSAQDDLDITGTNIPPEPDVDFKSAVQPVEALPPVEPPPMPLPVTGPGDQVEVAADNVIPAADSSTDNSTDTKAVSVTEPAPPVDAVQAKVIPVDNQTAAVLIPSEQTATRGMSAWVIQLGSFTSQTNADSLVRQLQNQGFPAYIEKVNAEASIVYKVRIGPELSRQAAETMVKDLKAKLNLDGMILSFP